MSPARRLLFAAVALLGVVAVAAGVLVARPGGQAAAPVVPDRPGTVVLVPGYGGSTRALSVLAARLRDEGRTAVVVDLPGDGTGDLRQAAEAVDRAVDRALDAGAPSVDLVGYSAGGVTVRWFLRELGGAERARRVVTLGSPHHGTTLAATALAVSPGACPTACAQLAPDSELLDRLNARDETPDGPAYLALWTVQDETVTPPDSGRLEGAVSLAVQDVCPGLQLAHGDLPRAPVVQELVSDALGAAPLARPATCPRPGS